jgi:hypothetical protein
VSFPNRIGLSRINRGGIENGESKDKSFHDGMYSAFRAGAKNASQRSERISNWLQRKDSQSKP